MLRRVVVAALLAGGALAATPRVIAVNVGGIIGPITVEILDHAMTQAAQGWIPLPPSLAALLLVLGGLLEIFGPICILSGFYRRQAALLFIFYVIATAVLFHNFWSFPFNGDAWNQNFWPFLKNFGLAGGFLYVAADAKMQSLRGAFSLNPH